MAKSRKRSEVVIETHEVLIIHQRRRVRSWCASCAAQTAWVGVEEAAAAAAANTDFICRQVQAGTLHAIEALDRCPLVCVNSLLNSLEQKSTG